MRNRADKACKKQVEALLARARKLLDENPALCVTVCDEAIRKANRTNGIAVAAQGFLIKGLAFRRLRNYPLALRCLRQSMRLYEEIGMMHKSASTLNNIGLVFHDMSNYTAALESYYHALRLCRAATDKDTMAILLNNIGNIYQEWRDSERAISYYHESLELKREIADEAGMAHTFNNLANEYTDLGKYAKARRYYLDALRLHQKSSDKKGEATSQLNIAKLHTKMSQIPAALLTLQQALTLSKTMKDKLLTANIWLEMGHIKLRENFFEEGKRLLYKAMRISKSINAQSIIYECHHSLYELYKQIGNSQKALMHLEMFYTVKTAVLGEETSRKLKNLEITHELEKEYRKTEAYRSQIGLLRDEAASKSKEIAAAAMHLIEKSNAVAGLRSQVIELTNEPKKKRRIKILKEVSVAMVSVMDSEKDWAAFERQFNYLYPHFAASLMAACETLTPVELNICALLRLNLATKEIGKVLHRTTRTVESHRNTLRRKLAVPTQTSLPAFLAKL